MEQITWLDVLVFNSVFAIICGYMAAKKGNTLAGVIVGFGFGILGVLIVLLSKDKTKAPCPSCQENISKKATICPFCRSKTGNTYTPLDAWKDSRK